MKIKSILSSILLLLLFTPVVAQRGGYAPQKSSKSSSSSMSGVKMVYGIAAGVVYPILDIHGGNIKIENHPGFKAGMMWGVDLGVVEIVPEVWYSNFKMDFKQQGESDAQLRNNSLDMPILVGVKLGRALRVNLGPTFSLMCNNKIRYSDGEEQEYGRLKSNVGYVAGVSYRVVENFFVDFRYTGRFTDSANEWSGSSPYDIWMYTLDLTAGFRF